MKAIKYLRAARTAVMIPFQLVFGLLCGFAGGLVGGAIGGVIAAHTGTDVSNPIYLFYGFITAFALFLPIGVYASGALIFRAKSSFWMTVLGSICVIMGVMTLAEPLGYINDSNLFFGLAICLPLLASVGIFNIQAKPAGKQ